MIHQLIEKVKEKGLNYLRLDTVLRAKKALALYRNLGFYEIPRYNDNVNAEIFMELKLIA